MSDLYFDELIAYWKQNLDSVFPASEVYLGRHIQDHPTGRYIVIFPLAGEEPLEDTGDTIIETIPFDLHIHAPTDEVVLLGRRINDGFNAGPPITANTMELQRVSRRYVREATDLHHFVARYEWTRYFEEAAA